MTLGIGLSDHLMYAVYLMNGVNVMFCGKKQSIKGSLRTKKRIGLSKMDEVVVDGISGFANRSRVLSDARSLYARFRLVVMVLLAIGGVESTPGPTVMVSANDLALFLAKEGHNFEYISKNGIGTNSFFVKLGTAIM